MSLSLSGAAVLLLWGPGGCAWEFTALLDSSDGLSDGSGSDTGSNKFYHFTAGGSPHHSTPPIPVPPSYVHVTLPFPICSWEPGLESEFLAFSYHGNETRGGAEMEGSTRERREWPDITRSRGCFQNYTSEPDWETEKLGNQEGKWFVH